VAGNPAKQIGLACTCGYRLDVYLGKAQLCKHCGLESNLTMRY
jgi:hypothetical protein